MLAVVLCTASGCGGSAEPAAPADLEVLCEGTGPVHWKSVSIFPDGAETLREAAVVWTGREILVWGSLTDPGFRYQPDTGTVRRITTQGAPSPRVAPYYAWTGEELVVWGGFGPWGDRPGDRPFYTDGGRYDPELDRWMPISPNPNFAPVSLQTVAWTGTELIIWGEGTLPGNANGGIRYNPELDRWTPMSTVGAPSPRRDAAVAWTGSELVVWGGEDVVGKTNTGGRYDPVTDSWKPTALLGAPEPRTNHSMTYVNGEVIVFGRRFDGDAGALGARYLPSMDSWLPLSEVAAPTLRFLHSAVSTGRRLIIFAGGVLESELSSPVTVADGGIYDPDTDTWTPLPAECSEGRVFHTGVWIDNGAFFWGGLGQKTGALLVTPP